MDLDRAPARRELVGSGETPCEHDATWRIDDRVPPADGGPADVDGEPAVLDRVEFGVLSHPRDEQVGAHEVLEDDGGLRVDVDRLRHLLSGHGVGWSVPHWS